MSTAIYPGSFDPVTNGHIDIIKRGAKTFDKVIVAVLLNVDKKGLFTIEERVKLLKCVTKDYKNVEIISFSGLLVDLAKERRDVVILKGLRNTVDFEYELQMGNLNKILNSELETIFMMSSPEFAAISSSAVKGIAKFGGKLEGLVPKIIEEELIKKIDMV